MTRMPLAQRRQQLVDAAIAVLTREGVSKATTRAIVAEAGTSLSVFHYCFDSKQELLDAVIKSLVGRTVDLAEASFEAGASRRQMIRAGLGAYWQHVVANPDQHLLTYELTQYALRSAPESAMKQYDAYLDLNRKFLTVLINFLILAFIIFLIVRSANKLKRKQADAAPAADPEEVVLLREIRDALKKG